MSESKIPIGCVVLAAGKAARFGENKLAAQFGGKSLIRRALEAVPADRLAAVAVVTGYPEVRALAESFGFPCVWNDRPELGQSLSVRLGTEAIWPCCRAAMYMVADQPLLRRESAAALLDAYLAQPGRIVSAARGGVRGNPCIFPEVYFPELCALSGDVGGGAVIRRHSEALRLCELPERELADVDTPAALDALKNISEA